MDKQVRKSCKLTAGIMQHLRCMVQVKRLRCMVQLKQLPTSGVL